MRSTILLLTMSAASVMAGEISVMKSLTSATDGDSPQGTLLLATDNRLYGVSTFGGEFDGGTLFRIDPDGSDFLTLFAFGNGANAPIFPNAVSEAANNGLLYGTTSTGGTDSKGAVFQIEKGGLNFTVVHSFTDGSESQGGLLRIGNAFFGTTSFGAQLNSGTLFRFDSVGLPDFTNFVEFADENTGRTVATLTNGGNGRIYGVTTDGGVSGNGILFSLTTAGADFTKHIDFSVIRGTDAEAPLIDAGNGFLYGAALNGGSGSQGTIFRIAKDGSGFQVLHSLSGQEGDEPYGLTLSADGRIYGICRGGGAFSNGTAFRIRTDGSGFVKLADFGAPGSASVPNGPLLETTTRSFVGVSRIGGALGDGTIYRLVATDEGPSVKIKGKKKLVTTRARVRIRGTASDDYGIASVGVRVRKGAFKDAKGTESWSFRTKKLRVGKTKVTVLATDEEGNTSTAKMIIVREV